MRFASFFCGEFITAIVINPLERKLAKRTSMQWSKAYLVLNAKSIIQIFNEIYAAYRKTAAVAVLKPCTLGGLASKSAQFLYIIQWCNNVFLPEVLRGYIKQAFNQIKKFEVNF